MSDLGTTIGLIKALAPEVDPADITAAVDDWLDDHPEATTTVEDGSITRAKLASGLEEDIADLEQDTSDLKSAINESTTNKNAPVYTYIYTGQASSGYINRNTAAVVSNSDYEYLELPKSAYCYIIAGDYSKNSALTPVVYVNENGQKVGEDNLSDSGGLYTSGYTLTYPTGATKALITRKTDKTLTISQYCNGNSEVKKLSGQILKPTISQDFTSTGVTTVYTSIRCYPGHRYFILTSSDIAIRVGVVASAWDFYADNKFVYGTPSAEGRVCIGTSGAGTGTVHVFDTTDNDALNAFLVENNVNFASTPYGSLIYDKLLASYGKWYEPLSIGNGSFSGSTASVFYTNIYTTSGHRYVFIADGTGITSIGTIGGSGWVERIYAKVGMFTPDGSYRFGIEYTTNASGDYWVFDTTDNDDLNEYLLASAGNYDMTQADAITTALSKSVNHERSKYFGKKVVAFGDSITAQKKWFPGVSEYFGSPPLHLGVGGSTVTSVGSNGFCTDARVSTIPTDTDLLLIMGGVNDWSIDVAIGDRSLTNADTTTIYGAVNTLVDKLNARVPNAKIVCMGCTFAMTGTQNDHSDRADTLNTLGLATLDYGKALADAFAMNGIESFVIGESCGWNSSNISTYVNWDGAYFHPNDAGGARMAEVIIKHVG